MSLVWLANIPDYEEFPLQQPPPGLKANFINPETNAYQVYVVSAVCIVLVCISAGIRFTVKAFYLKVRTRDDIPYLCAVIANLAYIVLIVILVHNGGYGVHAWDVQLKTLTVHQIRLSLVVMYLYNVFVWIIKAPLFLMYLEIFGRLRWLRYSCWIAMAVTGIFYFASLVSLIVFCSPPTGQYTQLDYLSAISSETCAQNKSLSIGSAVINIGSDFFLLLLPLPAIWSLQLSFKKKVGISAICLTGLIACACSVVGLWGRLKSIASYTPTSNDNTWTTTPLWILTICEMTCGVLIPAAPSMSVFWQRTIAPLASRFTTQNSRLWTSQKSSKSGSATYEEKFEMGSQGENAYRVISDRRPEVSHIRKTTEVLVSATHLPGPRDRRDYL